MARKIFILRKDDIWVIYTVPLMSACKKCVLLHGNVYTFENLPRCSCTPDNDYIGYSPESADRIPKMKIEAAEAMRSRSKTCLKCGTNYFMTDLTTEAYCAKCYLEVSRERTSSYAAEQMAGQKRVFDFIIRNQGCSRSEIQDVLHGSPVTGILEVLSECGAIIEYRNDEDSVYRYRAIPTFVDSVRCSGCGIVIKAGDIGDFLIHKGGEIFCSDCMSS